MYRKRNKPDILNSPSRLRAVEASGLREPSSDATYEVLTEKICFELRAPLAFISIIDKDWQHFKSPNGLPAHIDKDQGMPLSHSFCQYVMYRGEPMVIEDMADSYEFHRHPAHIDFGVMAYIGEPLYYNGEIIGAVCAIHFRPRHWSEADRLKLRRITQDIQAEMYFRRLPSLD